jgi:hypothetical protein
MHTAGRNAEPAAVIQAPLLRGSFGDLAIISAGFER